MEDVITEAAPPSRFLEEDLNIFTPPSPPLPSTFILFSHPRPHPQQPLKPTLLIIALSPPSLTLFHHHRHKTLIASLILPELPLSPASPHPSLSDPTANIYSLSAAAAGDGDGSVLLVSVQCSVAADRAHAVAKLLVGDRIGPESVLVLDSVRARNYRGRLSNDVVFALKLESSAERKRKGGEKLLEDLEYYPSGSVVDGLGAAILGRCQMLNVRASLCVSWPEFDASVVSLLKGVLRNGVLRGLNLDFSFGGGVERDEVLRLGKSKDRLFESELYT